jgi:PadR family transcriptional regulator, regulatory protein PadR
LRCQLSLYIYYSSDLDGGGWEGGQEIILLTYIAVLGYRSSMLSKELVAASTKPLVLAILAEGESYGYALIRRVRELSDDRIQWSEGMLYPFLHWMEAEGLIESAWKQSDTGRRRKYYRISRKGGKELEIERERWLSVHETLTKLWKTRLHST